MNKIEITVPEGMRAEWVNGVLTLVEDGPKNVTDRIKTFEDACRELGDEHQYVRAYREWMRIGYAGCEDIVAYLKLRIIIAALNEGWEPQFTEDEYRYYPWFYLYKQEEIDAMDEKQRQGLHLFGGAAHHGAYAGFACARSYGTPSGTSAPIGSRLCMKTRDLAVYCGQQFCDVWADYLLIVKKGGEE